MKNRIGMQPNTWPQRSLLVAGVLCAGLLASAPAQAKQDIPLVVDAIEKAQQAPTDKGKWQITAEVVITSETKPKMTASGVVTVSGDEEEGRLSGTLPMTIDGVAGGNQALAFNLKRDGEVGIQWLIAGKAFLGRGMKFYQAIPNPGGDYLSRKIKWNGVSRFMVIKLAAEQVKVSTATPPPIRIPKPKEPIGKRYKITGYAQVTNSDDGPGDHTVEVLGYVATKYRRGDKWIEKELIPLEKKRSLGKNDSIDFEEFYVDSLFSKPTANFYIWGNFVDVDDASANDLMWEETGEGRGFNLDKRVALKGQSVIPGDRDSENIEVYFTVKEAGDIF